MNMTYVYAYPKILDSIVEHKSASVAASAGTGKTYTIEHLIVHLLLAKGNEKLTLAEILVVTFTNKAAAELVGRVRKIFHDILRGEKLPKKDEGAWTIGQPERQRLRAFLQSFDEASIYTIHGFCQRILDEHAFHHGRLFTQEPVSSKTLFHEAWRETLRTAFADPLRQRLLLATLHLEGADFLNSGLEGVLYQANGYAGQFQPGWPRDGSEPFVPVWALTDALRQEILSADVGAVGGVLWNKGGNITVLSALTQEVLPLIHVEMRRIKQRTGVLEYNDMLLGVWETLQDPDRKGPLINALRKKHRVGIIDEFQDTDSMQWDIFRTLFLKGDPTHRLYVVGDDKQSIYGWRSADIQTYRDAVKGLDQKLEIQENRRSTSMMIEAFKVLFQVHEEKQFFTNDIDYPTVQATSTCMVKDSKHALKPVRLLNYTDEANTPRVSADVARKIAMEIKEVKQANISYVFQTEEKTVAYKDIFVLTRKTRESLLVADELASAGIPFVFYKQEGLFKSHVAVEILKLFRGLEDPGYAPYRLGALKTRFFNVPLEQLQNYKDADETNPLVKQLGAWKELADARSYGRLFTALLEASGLTQRELYLHESERDIANFQHIFELLLEGAARQRCTIADLARMLHGWIQGYDIPGGDEKDVQRVETEEDAVRIMTIHKCKGLQAAVVFVFNIGGNPSDVNVHKLVMDAGGTERKVLVGAGDKETPIPFPAGCEPVKTGARLSAEEDARLCYVAATRAMIRLYLPYGPEIARMKGSYAPLAERLGLLLENGKPGEGLLKHFDILDFGHAEVMKVDRVRDLSAVPFTPLSVPVGSAAPFDTLKKNHEATVMRSFTSLQRSIDLALEEGGRAPGETPELPEGDDFKDGDLPRGPKTGDFLHSLLESAEPHWFSDDNEDWFANQPAAEEMFHSVCQGYGVRDEAHQAHAKRLVYLAMTGPLEVGGETIRIYKVEALLREPEIFYPLALPSTTNAARFIKGFIDVVFVHKGKVYFADWKSNSLKDYRRESLKQVVQDEYGLQALLYGFAIFRYFGITEANYDTAFGGYLYLFLRGMKSDGDGTDGVHFGRRATWAEWEQKEHQARALLLLPPNQRTAKHLEAL